MPGRRRGNRARIARVALFGAFALLVSRSAFPFDMAISSGAIHLPAEEYHRLGYMVEMGFGASDDWSFNFQVGASHPSITLGFRENVGYAFLGPQYFISRKHFIKPYAGAGLGVYVHRVNKIYGTTPSLATKAGFRIGGGGFGIFGEVSHFMGIFSTSHLVVFTAWPMINLMGGFYIGL